MTDYKQLAELGLTFLGRTDLKGSEIGNLQQVANMLGSIAKGELELKAPQKPDKKKK